MTLKRVWTPASVGCHWNSGPYIISTRVLVLHGKPMYTHPESGYVLYKEREGEIGIYKTLRDAQMAVEE